MVEGGIEMGGGEVVELMSEEWINTLPLSVGGRCIDERNLNSLTTFSYRSYYTWIYIG